MELFVFRVKGLQTIVSIVPLIGLKTVFCSSTIIGYAPGTEDC